MKRSPAVRRMVACAALLGWMALAAPAGAVSSKDAPPAAQRVLSEAQAESDLVRKAI